MELRPYHLSLPRTIVQIVAEHGCAMLLLHILEYLDDSHALEACPDLPLRAAEYVHLKLSMALL